MKKLINFIQDQTFGVCTWWGEKLGIPTYKIRLFFIYLSFIALGSPVLIYLIMAFLLDLKDQFKKKTHSYLRDL